MSILKAFKSTVIEIGATARDYNKVSLDAFKYLSGGKKIELKILFDNSIEASKRLSRSDKISAQKLYNVVSSFMIKNKEHDILRTMANHGIGNEYALKKAVDKSDPIATRILLEAGANPNTEYSGKINKNGLGERYGDFNCLGKACIQSYNNASDRDNQDVMLALLDHGATPKLGSVLVSDRGRSPFLSGKELFDNHSPFSMEEYKTAVRSKTFDNSPTTSVSIDLVKEYDLEKNPKTWTKETLENVSHASAKM